MLVVSDTSPITNLIQIDLLSILQQLYGQIIIPSVVYGELCEIESQKILIDSQSWIQIMTSHDEALIMQLEMDLDKGESESIVLAIELNADLLLMDESKGRQIAQEMGLKIVGLLGTLLFAKREGLITEIKPIIKKLVNDAGFHIHPKLQAQIIQLAGE
ncbi:MAG: DUF3368 domain-containing protein [Spirosomaceae bacterium]|jgi:hypothetical protein|nr:DUF3368 domain-containing protein [Spirosomataceae bacterium]